jgi:hypothetical protein
MTQRRAARFAREHVATKRPHERGFRLSDGTEKSFEGYFCCEVEFEKQPASLAELSAFLREHDGESP